MASLFVFEEIVVSLSLKVSTGSICVLCKLKIMEDLNQCFTPGICWCEDITDKEKLMNCGRETRHMRNF